MGIGIQLTKGEKFIYDWQYDLLGSFNKSLAEAISRADGYNFSKLRLGFPNETDAMWNFQNTENWWEDLEDKVEQNRNKIENKG